MNGTFSTSEDEYRLALRTARIAGLFCLVVCATMLFQHFTATNNNPWTSPEIRSLKAKLQAAPKDEQIKQRIRDLDFKYRQRFFLRLGRDRLGGWFLLGGAAVFMAAAYRVSEARRKLPMPTPNPNAGKDAVKQTAAARTAVLAAGSVSMAGLIVLALGRGGDTLPGNAEALQKMTSGGGQMSAKPDFASLAEFQANWPRFRGPDGSGFSKYANVPVSWDSKTGAGIVWKAAVPAPGFNSPLIWNDRIFLSGGTAEKREVFAFDTADGHLVWRRAIENVPESPAKQPVLSEQTGYAASTMAMDGSRLYVIFPNGDLAALTVDGNPVWSKNLGVPKNQYGHATSLAVWMGRVIVQYDQGDAGPANSRLLAFDGASGRSVWEKSRPVASSWATPIVVEAAGKTQIVTLGAPFAIGYSFTDGAELWRVEGVEGEVTPSPISGNGMAYVVCPSSKLMAIKLDGSGDVTKTHIAWTSDDNIPDVTSPATDGEFVFTVTGAGFLTCVDAKTGKKQWDHDFSFEVQASPGIAGKCVYIVGAGGEMGIVEAGRQFKSLGKGTLADKFYASPAFADGRLYLRGVANLWCIGGSALKKP